jgi:hypothetical protein
MKFIIFAALVLSSFNCFAAASNRNCDAQITAHATNFIHGVVPEASINLSEVYSNLRNNWRYDSYVFFFSSERLESQYLRVTVGRDTCKVLAREFKRHVIYPMELFDEGLLDSVYYSNHEPLTELPVLEQPLF